LESATKVIEVLDGRTGSLPALLNPRLAQWVTLASWPPHRRFIGLAGILIVFVALYVGGYRLYKTSTDSKVNPGALVYLTQIRNLTGERSFDNLTELLKAGLGQSAQINLLDQSRVGDTLQLMTKGPNTVIDEPLAREIAMRTGALRVVFATVTGSAGTYQIHIDIQKPDTVPDRYRERWEENFPYKISASLGSSSTIPPELLTAVRNASDWIRFETGESRNDIALLNTPPEDVTTSSWKALAAYSRAESLSSKHEKDDALSALQAAVAEDPQFALAYARMGDVDVSLGRSEDGYRAYARALDTSFDRRLTRRELDRIRGIYASDTWDYSAAESAFRDYALFFPNDFRGWFYRALPLMHLGRYEEAIATLKNAERVDPGGIYAPYDLALCFIELGDVGSSKRWIGVLRERHDIEAADELDGILAFLAGDSESAERYFELVRKSPIGGFRLEGFALLDRIHAERGDLEGSLAASTSGASEAASQGNPAQQARFLLDQASAECGLRKFRGCLTSIHQATSLDSSPELLLSAGDIAAQAMTSISVADARPFHDLLRTLSTSIPQEKLNTAYTLVSMRLHAELFASSGRIDEGLQEAHRAAAIDTQYRRRDQLARLLLRAAVQTDSPSKRTALHSEAYENLALSALHPTTIWLQPTLYPPGAWADDLHSLVETLPLASHSDSKLQTAESLFNAIRSTHITSRKGT
jgi:tetratricopeptide (TPR) repeat protein